MDSKLMRWAGALIAAVVVGCGGGGGGSGGSFSLVPAATTGASDAGSTTSAMPSLPAERSLSGTVATGAPFDNATVVVRDATGTVVCKTQTDHAGTYQCALPEGTNAPLALVAEREEQRLYSVTAHAGGTANITTLTTVMASRLSANGDPAAIADTVRLKAGAIGHVELKQQKVSLAAALKSVTDALGLRELDPVEGPFSANGTGQDAVLDALAISVRPDGTAANIEITLKTLAASATKAPVSLSFRSDDAVIPTLPPLVAPEELASIPVPAMVNELISRLNGCYQLPLSQRVRALNDTDPVVGDASDLLATPCRTLFLGNDPAVYLSNGVRVGRDINNAGSFTSLFRPDATALRWDRGNFEYFRANGDATLSYRTTDLGGNVVNGTLTVRNEGGSLKLVGDGHRYSAAVRPVSAHRDMINSPLFSAYTTGYGFLIANRVVNGVSIFRKVIVTMPSGDTMTLIPQPGLSILVTTKADGVTPLLNNGIVLRGQYENPSAPGNLADREPGIGIVSPQLSDQQIAQLKDQSLWKLEFVHVDANTPNVTQYERTLSRAETLAEIRHAGFIDLTPAMRTKLTAATATDGGLLFGAPSQANPNMLDLSAPGNADAWTVPDGAVALSTLTVYGSAPQVNNLAGGSFNDSVALSSTMRKAVVRCMPDAVGDNHCDGSAGLQYAQGTKIRFLSMEGRDGRAVNRNKFILFYKQY